MTAGDDEIFLSRYSSHNFVHFYSNYKDFIEKINAAPPVVKKEFILENGKYDFKKLASFFNTFQDESNNILYRKSDRAKDIVVTLWLYKVQAKVKIVEAFPLPVFKGLSHMQAREIISKNNNEKSYLEIPLLLIRLGIIVIFERAFSGLNVDGAVYTSKDGNPVIALSLRYDRLDNFWFTLAHELAHVVLHYDQLNEIIVDDLDEPEKNADSIELEANKLASDMLIPRSIWRSCPVKHHSTAEDIKEFSKEVNIHPAIIAGRIRKEKNNYKLFNEIIFAEKLRKEFFDE